MPSGRCTHCNKMVEDISEDEALAIAYGRKPCGHCRGILERRMTLREYTISDLQAVHDRLEARGWKGEPDGDDEVWEALFLVRTENHLSLSHVSHEDSLGLYFQRNDRKGPVIVESEVIELQRVMNG